ncbi:unnamed protein product [Adineta ricciae]|uniref:Uncharacterized protein n=1 Tax=Adineta ricciae TaxID=249248 RepID=A0A815BSM0_ADIRI|nr:unnamed protein product [Adineta ricciae]CAF1273880.1 unnamed protein product [Adineta ricciae]
MTSTVNSYISQMNELNIEQIHRDAENKLAYWRNDSHRRINEFYQEKLEELQNYITEVKALYETKMRTIGNYLNQLANQQDMSEEDSRLFIHSTNQAIQQTLEELKQICVQINPHPIIIDESEICIGKNFSLKKLARCSSQIPYTESSSAAIATNNEFILLHQHPNLCLFNRSAQLIRQCLWTDEWIRDMCWSTTLQLFFIITSSKVFFADEQIMSIGTVDNFCRQTWFSCTCSDRSLYLSTYEWGSSIFEFNLQQLPALDHQWKPPMTCKPSEGINDIQYSNETLALMVKDGQAHERYLVVKSIRTFDTIWSFSLGSSTNIRLMTCCPLKNNEWLVVDGAQLQIYHITGRGKNVEKIHFESAPYRASFLGSSMLVVASELSLNSYSIWF